DILRDQVERGTELGRAANVNMEEGLLVPDSIVVKMLLARLEEPDAKAGFILDGFPRSLPQAVALDEALRDRATPLTAVVDLTLPDGHVRKRLEARVQCSACKTPYNLVQSPPAVEGVCDRCGGKLVPRNDDKDAKIRRRLGEYHEAIPLLREFYESRGIFHRIDADASQSEVGQRLRAALAG
ncbi:MAG: nucleoside monophosphate kinase, partial [Actinobacteria bacterium]|nr:nucleoside monophosphate kinase [Actinomycetota bacterium]